MKKYFYIISICIFVILNLNSCATMVISNVSVFHTLDTYPKEKTFYIFPLKEQEGSLEYKHYAQIIGEQLTKQGYKLAADLTKANIVVMFNYLIDNGRQEIDSLPVFGQTGVSRATTNANIYTSGNIASGTSNTTYTPTYGIVGSETTSRTVYKRLLLIRMVDQESVVVQNKAEVIFETKVISEGSSNQILEVLPSMIKAVFQDFPGANGKTRKVILPFESK